jgi:hypothetical protein
MTATACIAFNLKLIKEIFTANNITIDTEAKSQSVLDSIHMALII